MSIISWFKCFDENYKKRVRVSWTNSNSHNDIKRLSIEEGAMDMMEEVFLYIKSGSYKDAFNYINIVKNMLKEAGYTPDKVFLSGFMPPPRFYDLKTIRDIEKYIEKNI